MLKLEYDYDEKIIYSFDHHGGKKVVSRDFPSEPKISPNKELALYISPLEWECLGSVYLFDLTTGSKEVLISPDEKSNIPKDVVWVDDNTLAVIVGYCYGTVAIGGNIFLFQLSNKVIKQITFHDSKTQLTKLSYEDNKLLAKGINYIDDALDKFKEHNEIIDYVLNKFKEEESRE